MVLCGPNVELRRRPWRSERFLSRLQSGPLVVKAQILNCSIMAAFLHRRPNTGMNVQGWVADDPTEGEGETYQPITCMICTRLHLVDPKTEWSSSVKKHSRNWQCIGSACFANSNQLSGEFQDNERGRTEAALLILLSFVGSWAVAVVARAGK